MSEPPNLDATEPSTQEELSPVEVLTIQETTDEEAQQERIVEPQIVVESPPPKRSIGGISFKGPARLSSTVLKLSDLPEDVADNLRQYDINGDGMISMTELVHGALAQQEQEEKVFFFCTLDIRILQTCKLFFNRTTFSFAGYLLSPHDRWVCADLDFDDGGLLRRGLRSHRGQ